jgi:hypothetical protein
MISILFSGDSVRPDPTPRYGTIPESRATTFRHHARDAGCPGAPVRAEEARELRRY